MTVRLALLALLGGCAVEDADLLQNPAMSAIDVTASTDLVASRQTQITGTLTLGYTSDQMVAIRILDNGSEVWAGSAPASALAVPIDATVSLDAYGNDLVVEATYNGQHLQQDLSVDVPAAIQGLTVAPSATETGVFTVGVTGTAQFGWTSAEPATLEILVEGQAVHDETIDVSTATEAPIDVDVPLSVEGSNDIVAVLRYGGEEQVSRFTVDVGLLAPSVLFPSLNNNYTPRIGMISTGMATVTPPAGYTVESVAWSVDGGAWTPAPYAGGNGWTLSIVNPDIGDSLLALSVTTITDGHRRQTMFSETFHVDPIFSCEPESMLPDNDMIQNLGTEQRALIGYFGRSDGGHFVQFTVQGDSNGDNYAIVGQNLRYDPAAIETMFNVSRLQCNQNNNNNCSTSYTLTATIDGTQICSRSNFGQINRY